MKSKQTTIDHDMLVAALPEAGRDAFVKALQAKELPPITDEEKEELVWKGIFDPIPYAVEPGAPEEYSILAIINGLENEVREILKADGYPLTPPIPPMELFVESLSRPRADRIRDNIRALYHFRDARIAIRINDLEAAALFLAYGVKATTRARIRLMEPLIDMGKKVVGGGKQGGKKSGKVRRENAKPIMEAWQVEAEKIWQKHPQWKNKRVAAGVKKNIGGNIDTIRKSIKKPLL